MAQSYYCREPEVRTTLAASPIANFGFASVLRFRSSLSSVRQTQANFGIGTLKRDGFSSNRHPALGYCWSMMFSENRYPLFGIMLQLLLDRDERRHKTCLRGAVRFRPDDRSDQSRNLIDTVGPLRRGRGFVVIFPIVRGRIGPAGAVEFDRDVS